MAPPRTAFRLLVLASTIVASTAQSSTLSNIKNVVVLVQENR